MPARASVSRIQIWGVGRGWGSDLGFLTFYLISVDWELSKQRQHNINQKAQAVMKGNKMKEPQELKAVLKFQLEFMLMMQSVGRIELANDTLTNLFKTIEQVEGTYNPQ
jgi:hypothetical protein